MKTYINIVLVAISCLANALLGGKRYEMFSSRAFRCEWWTVVWLIELVFGEWHCSQCYKFERENFDGIQD